MNSSEQQLYLLLSLTPNLVAASLVAAWTPSTLLHRPPHILLGHGAVMLPDMCKALTSSAGLTRHYLQGICSLAALYSVGQGRACQAAEGIMSAAVLDHLADHRAAEQGTAPSCGKLPGQHAHLAHNLCCCSPTDADPLHLAILCIDNEAVGSLWGGAF